MQNDPSHATELTSDSTGPSLQGELGPTPRGTVVTILRGVFGISLVSGVLRGIGRLAFGFRRPGEFRLTERGLLLRYRTELAGRVLGERSLAIPLANIAQVSREVRYARAGLFLGLVALAVGTYVGVGLVIDGFRVASGSMSLVGLGLGMVVASLASDFVLTSFFDSARGKCSITVRPRAGSAVVFRVPDRSAADAFLHGLSRAHGYRVDLNPADSGMEVLSPEESPSLGNHEGAAGSDPGAERLSTP